MNYLQLCQQTAVECGVASRSAILTALPTIVGATGSLARVVMWVADAWNDVQCEFDDWDWMRSSNLLGGGVSFTTTAGQASYPLGLAGDFDMDFDPDWAGTGTIGIDEDAFGKWDRDTFRCYPTAMGVAGEMSLDEVPYDCWRDGYMIGAMRSVQTRPVVIAIGPNQSLNLGPPPNALYTITGDYFVAPSEMIADTDTPLGLPRRFHGIITSLAMMKYAGYESAPEVYQRGDADSKRMYNQLQAVRAPKITFGGALA